MQPVITGDSLVSDLSPACAGFVSNQTQPGACAPGFTLTPAPQAKTDRSPEILCTTIKKSPPLLEGFLNPLALMLVASFRLSLGALPVTHSKRIHKLRNVVVHLIEEHKSEVKLSLIASDFRVDAGHPS